jgi:plastocyanin
MKASGRLRGLAGLAAGCAALALAAGCGESSKPGTASAGGTPTSGAAAAQTSGDSGSSTTSSGASKKSSSGGLKYDTTPKYATPSSSEAVHSGVVQIAYRNIAIDPDTVRVKVGTTVKWTNYDPVVHNVTSEGGPLKFASKNFGEGQSFEVKLTKPGVVHYECTLQPATMNGTIEVVS